jgi:hypothetical protein
MDSLLNPVAVHSYQLVRKVILSMLTVQAASIEADKRDHAGLSRVSHNKERETEKEGGW